MSHLYIPDRSILSSLGGYVELCIFRFLISLREKKGRFEGRIELDYPKSIEVQTHLENAYSLGLLCHEGRQYVLSHLFVLLHVPSDDSIKKRFRPAIFFPHFSFLDLKAMGLCQIKNYSVSDISRMTDSELMITVVEHLKGGEMVALFVNEFYIPETDSYRKYCFRHLRALIGYDGAKKSFIGLGYLRDGSFASRLIPFNAVLMALRSNGGKFNENEVNIAMRAICPNVFNAKDIDTSVIRAQYLAHLNSKPEICFPALTRIFRGHLPKPRSSTTGFEAWDRYFDYTKSCYCNGEKIDSRMTRIFWERQKIALIRYQEVLKRRVKMEKHLSALKALVQHTFELHLMGYDWNVNGKTPDLERIDFLSKKSKKLDLESTNRWLDFLPDRY